MIFRFTVSYEGEIEAPDPDSARSWALEEVEAGHFLPVIVEALPVPAKGECVTVTEYEKDVAAAAKMMDRRRRGWFRRIVWKRLDMADECNCIAGQSGLDWAELADEFERKYPDSLAAPFADEYTVPAWVNEVRKRRASVR